METTSCVRVCDLQRCALREAAELSSRMLQCKLASCFLVCPHNNPLQSFTRSRNCPNVAVQCRTIFYVAYPGAFYVHSHLRHRPRRLIKGDKGTPLHCTSASPFFRPIRRSSYVAIHVIRVQHACSSHVTVRKQISPVGGDLIGCARMWCYHYARRVRQDAERTPSNSRSAGYVSVVDMCHRKALVFLCEKAFHMDAILRPAVLALISRRRAMKAVRCTNVQNRRDFQPARSWAALRLRGQGRNRIRKFIFKH